jgi:hypothetical protein
MDIWPTAQAYQYTVFVSRGQQSRKTSGSFNKETLLRQHELFRERLPYITSPIYRSTFVVHVTNDG